MEHFRYFWVFEFLQIKSDARAPREALCFQHQLGGCKNKVRIAANVGTWERSCVCFVDARLEAFGCQNEGNLDVYLPIRGMPDCYPGQLVGMESVGKGESVALCKLVQSSSVVCLSNASSSYCPCPVLVCARAYFGNLIALNREYILQRMAVDLLGVTAVSARAPPSPRNSLIQY